MKKRVITARELYRYRDTDVGIETSIRSHGTTVDVDVFKYGTLATSVSRTKTGVVAVPGCRAGRQRGIDEEGCERCEVAIA